MFRVITSDNQPYSLDQEAYQKSDLIKDMFDGLSPDDDYEAPLINVPLETLSVIDTFLLHYKGQDIQELRQPLEHKTLHPDDGIPVWDAEFITEFSDDKLYDILNAANYLGVKGLVQLCCARIALVLKKKTVDKYGKINEEELKFYLSNGMTREEAKQLGVEAKWA